MKNREVLISLSLAGILFSIFTKIKLFILSGVLLFIYLALPMAAEFLGKNFLCFAKLSGKVLSFIFLTIAFYLILFPISFLFRLKHSNSLFLKPEGITSTFVNRMKEYKKEDLENMW